MLVQRALVTISLLERRLKVCINSLTSFTVREMSVCKQELPKESHKINSEWSQMQNVEAGEEGRPFERSTNDGWVL
jgi:hypothetical protein